MPANDAQAGIPPSELPGFTAADADSLLQTWLNAARGKLAEPDKLEGRAFARIGELVLSAAHWLAEREQAARFAEERAARAAARGGQR